MANKEKEMEKVQIQITDEELSKRMEKFPQGMLMSVINCSDSIKYNGNWGFISDSDGNKEDVKAVFEELKEDKTWGQHAPKVHRVRNGYLMVYNVKDISKITNYLSNESIIDEEWLQNAKIRKQKAIKKLASTIEKIIQGKEIYNAKKITKGSPERMAFILGLYGTNASTEVYENGTNYLACQLSLKDFMGVITKMGIAAHVGMLTNQGFVPVSKLLEDTKLIPTVYKEAVVSESKHALLFKLTFIKLPADKVKNPFK